MKYIKGENLSVGIMDNLIKEPLKFPKKAPLDEIISNLMYFKGMVKIMEDLGWYEHTSDWDPYLVIKLHNGKEILSCSGYADFEFLAEEGFVSGLDGMPNHIRITHDVEDKDGEWEPKEMDIMIKDIRSITVYK